MLLEPMFPTIFFAAQIALESNFQMDGVDMIVKSVTEMKSHITMRTFKSLVIAMNDFMLSHITGSNKFLFTVCTTEAPLVGVDEFMPVEVSILPEAFLAYVTNVWSFVRMDSNMSFPMTLPAERFSTVLTDMFLFSEMRSQMFLQQILSFERFVTFSARKCFAWNIKMLLLDV